MGLGVFFKSATGIRRMPFFRFTLMVIRADHDPAFRPASTAWSAVKGETLLSLPASNPMQQLIDRRLAQSAEDFTSFLKSYIARWAARAGVL